jgi:ATP-dependent Clp protease ATP-binding subunit ClpC
MSEKLLKLAQTEASRTRCNAIGTEHILLAILADGRNTAVELLRELGVHLERARQEIEWKLPASAGAQPPGKLPMSPQAQQVIDAAGKIAQKFGSSAIESEHLLLALLQSPGTAGEVLAKLGAKASDVQELLDAGDR